MSELQVVRGADRHPILSLLNGDGEVRALVWPGMGARCRTMLHFQLRTGASTVVLRHDGEAVYYVIAGSAAVEDLDSQIESPLREGSVVHVEPGTMYRIRTNYTLEMVGGPCPPDPSLFNLEETP